MRLIDADELKHKVMSWLRPATDEMNMVDADNVTVSVIMEIEEAPTVDPVKHGHWIKDSEFDQNDNANYHCSHCGRGDTHAKQVVVNYCWGCGCKMDEVVDG